MQELPQVRQALKILKLSLKKNDRSTCTYEQLVAARHLSPEQKTSMLKYLSAHPGHVILQSMKDGEAPLYAAEFLQVFKQAGWVVQTQFPMGMAW